MSSASADRPRLYGRTTCSDTANAREHFAKHAFDYQWIDIDEDDDGRTFVREINGGFESTPVLVLPDGRYLVEPSDSDLASITS